MLMLVLFRAPTHYRPHFGVAQHAFPYVGRRCVETIVKTWVGGDRLDQGFREKENRGWCSWRCQRWARGVSPCRGIVQPMSREEADRRIEALRHEIALEARRLPRLCDRHSSRPSFVLLERTGDTNSDFEIA
jgi:hypothetical protein